MVALPTVASEPAVFRGLIAVKYAAATQWSEPVVPSGGSADFDHRPVSTTVCFLTFSSDSRMNGSRSGSVPVVPGSQRPGAMPCGMKIPTKRFGGAAVWASANLAGAIASSRGKASVTPDVRRNVRRGMCRLVMKDIWASLSPRRADGRLAHDICIRSGLGVHLKRRTLDDANDDGSES